MPTVYALPPFLDGVVNREKYVDWLGKKAAAHARRDRKRGNPEAKISEYKLEIHRAVIASQGLDYYTGEELDWRLIGTYNNKASQSGGRDYKARFALLPSADHVDDGRGPANFRICSWRTNDAKSDLSLPEFIELCRRVIDHSDKSPTGN